MALHGGLRSLRALGGERRSGRARDGRGLRGLPPAGGEVLTASSEPRPFAEPWEAQVFALVVTLQERGLFTAGEWAAALARTIRPDGAPEAAADYAGWLTALESLLVERGVAEPARMEMRAAAFARAAEATPHGQPIRLENDPLHRP